LRLCLVKLCTSCNAPDFCIRNIRVFDSMLKHSYVPAGTWSNTKE
jgi:hypothetical protein